jgi:23S rRNA pseudouridine1911/1915/1917 synthase
MDYRPLGESPRIVDETASYSVLYKPPLMFSAPLGSVLESTLLGWYAGHYPAVLDLPGGRGEGGLLHRLDFATEGLVLIAKTREAYESLRAQQAAGDFIKEYLAISGPADGPSAENNPLPGFPPSPARPPDGVLPGTCIESFFRPWGPGRKAVRPVTAAQALKGRKKTEIAGDQGSCYRTEILALGNLEGGSGIQEGGSSGPPVSPEPRGPRVFTLQIRRGFRHQIRCHLAWIGEPILYDTIYGGTPLRDGGNPIALRAWAFRFFDPDTGEQKNYRLPAF